MKTMEAKKRDLGMNLDMVRSLGMIPGIVYAKGIENIPVSVPENLVRSLWKDIKEKQPFTLDIEGTHHTVSMQDIQVHVVSGDILHMDFMVHTG